MENHPILFILWVTAGVLSAACMVFVTFLQYRNLWTFRVMREHTNAVYAWAMREIQAGREVDVAAAHHCLESYNRIMRRFWRWDLKHFITDQAMYNRIYSAGPKDTLQ